MSRSGLRILAAVVCLGLAPIPIVAQSDGSTAEGGAADPSEAWPIEWFPGLDFGLVVDDDLDLTVEGAVGGRFRKQIAASPSLNDRNTWRYLELGAELRWVPTRRVTLGDSASADPDDVALEENDGDGWGGRIALDGDIGLGNDGWGRKKKLTFGVLAESFEFDEEGQDDRRSTWYVPAAMLTWRTLGICELTNTVLYGSREDSELPDGAGDATIDAWGVEHTQIVGKPFVNSYCERTGPFRQVLRSDVTTVTAGFEARSERSSDAAIPDSWLGRLAVRHPIGGGAPDDDFSLWDADRWTVDGVVDLERFESESSSDLGYDPDRWLAGVGATIRIFGSGGRWRNLDVRAGYEARREFSETYSTWTLGVFGRLGEDRGGKPLTADSAGTLSRRRGQSGSTTPAVP